MRLRFTIRDLLKQYSARRVGNHFLGESKMRRFVVCSLGALLLLTGVANLRLNAEEPLTSGQPSKAATLMAQAAKPAYQNAVDEYLRHERSLDSLYLWSRRLLQVDLHASPDAKASLDAYRSHVARMKQEYDITDVLFQNGQRGGEADKEAGLQFYLAEANLLLLRQSGNGKPTEDSIQLAKKEAQTMKDAARSAFQATRAAHDAGTVPLDQMYIWSKNLLQANLDTAGPNERNRAYSDHRDEMNQLCAVVSAKHQMRANGGEADNYAAALFYLAEADFLLAKDNGQPTSKGAEAYDVTARDAYQEIAKRYAVDATDFDTLYLWSTRWMQAVIDTHQEKASAAYRDHRDRIEKLCDELNSLPANDRRGSAEKRQAAQFFLGEAELLVSQHADNNKASPMR
jgi:hypothetical protein